MAYRVRNYSSAEIFEAVIESMEDLMVENDYEALYDRVLVHHNHEDEVEVAYVVLYTFQSGDITRLVMGYYHVPPLQRAEHHLRDLTEWVENNYRRAMEDRHHWHIQVGR